MFPYGLKSGDSLPYGVVRRCPAEKKVRVSAREPVASGEGQRIPAQRPVERGPVLRSGEIRQTAG